MTEPPNDLALLSDISFCLHNILAELRDVNVGRSTPRSTPQRAQFITAYCPSVLGSGWWVVKADGTGQTIAAFLNREEAASYANQRNRHG
jgi:hypothetical protein